MITLTRNTPRGYLVTTSRVEMDAFVTWLLERLGLGGSLVELDLVDDATIAELNSEFMGMYGPTNVLSFPDTDDLHCEAPQIVGEDFLPEDYADDGRDCLANQGDPASDDDGEDGEPDPDRPMRLGAVAISLDTCAREARLYGQSPREHFYRLLCHGILHCAGLEHGEEMELITDEALDEIRTWEAV
ncbi:rRNA maturation RNase YbeY [Megalodesulfovibrio paquesii]